MYSDHWIICEKNRALADTSGTTSILEKHALLLNGFIFNDSVQKVVRQENCKIISQLDHFLTDNGQPKCY